MTLIINIGIVSNFNNKKRKKLQPQVESHLPKNNLKVLSPCIEKKKKMVGCLFLDYKNSINFT